jgi:hypothetical protein
MKKPYKGFIMLFASLAVLMAAPVFAEQSGSPIPFGGYRENGKCGCYGAKAAIKTANEARKVIEEFLVGHDLHIGAMVERPRFFRAELVDGNGAVRDVVIVDKINGRVRSIN